LFRSSSILHHSSRVYLSLQIPLWSCLSITQLHDFLSSDFSSHILHP
jgi:hypothetical protein